MYLPAINGPDPRAKHLRRLRRSRFRARVWGFWGATLGGAAAVAVPYAGLGLPDIGWAGLAGGTIAMAVYRFRDHRALAAQPIPEPRPPSNLTIGQQIAPMLGPVLGPLVDRPHRIRMHVGSVGYPAAERLNAAARVLPQLLGRLGPHAGDLPAEAAAAHRALRDLGQRLVLVEKTLAVATADTRPGLLVARDEVLARFTDGVDAYESLASAAAECVAAVARGGESVGEPGLGERLTEASERLAGLAYGMNEARRVGTPPTPESMDTEFLGAQPAPEAPQWAPRARASRTRRAEPTSR